MILVYCFCDVNTAEGLQETFVVCRSISACVWGDLDQNHARLFTASLCITHSKERASEASAKHAVGSSLQFCAGFQFSGDSLRTRSSGQSNKNERQLRTVNSLESCQSSKITRTMMHQRIRQIHSDHGFIGSSDIL